MTIAPALSTDQRFDVTKFLGGCDAKLAEDLSPHQRRIMLVYKQHASLEICGRWQEIFDPRLTVEQPDYVFAAPRKYYALEDAPSVKWFYNALSSAGSSVRLLTNEEIYLTDKGFMSEALYHIYMRGDTARAYGHEADDVEGYYVESRWSIVNWRFNEQARMIGERIYPAPTATLTRIPEEMYWTTDQVAEILNPEIEARWALLTD
jgi:hypothetical protein